MTNPTADHLISSIKEKSTWNVPAKNTQKRVTLTDVAKFVGVSKSTVSLVLQNDPAVNPTTRDKVLFGIKETGYVYNRRAASLRQNNRHDQFAIQLHSLRSPFTGELLDQFERLSFEDDFLPLFSSNIDSLSQQETLSQMYLEHNIAGMVLCPAPDTNSVWLESLWRKGLPTVQIMRQVAFSQCPSVTADNRSGVKDAVAYLISLGHQRIAFIGGNQQDSDFQERYSGYLDAMSQAGLPVYQEHCKPCPQTLAAGEQAFLQLQGNRITAVMCFTDTIAYGVLKACRESNLVIGQDIALVGFDDFAYSELTLPALSSIRVDVEQMARTSLALLQQANAGQSILQSHHKVPTKFIARASCGTSHVVSPSAIGA